MQRIYLNLAVLNGAFLIFGLMLLGCLPMTISGEETDTAGTNASTVNNIQVMAVKDYYDDALAIAHKWQPDAYLQSATTPARQRNATPGLRIIYDFFSKSARSEALLVWFLEDATSGSKSVNMRGSSEDRREIEDEDWKLDSVEALQIAQEHSGNEYLNKYSSVEIDLFLEYQRGIPDGQVIWRVSYLRIDNGDRIDIEVDALTGEVVSVIK